MFYILDYVIVTYLKWLEDGRVLYTIAPGHEIIADVSLVGTELFNFVKSDIVEFGTKREVIPIFHYLLIINK